MPLFGWTVKANNNNGATLGTLRGVASSIPSYSQLIWASKLDKLLFTKHRVLEYRPLSSNMSLVSAQRRDARTVEKYYYLDEQQSLLLYELTYRSRSRGLSQRAYEINYRFILHFIILF
jgi:hypothetical protein